MNPKTALQIALLPIAGLTATIHAAESQQRPSLEATGKIAPWPDER